VLVYADPVRGHWISVARHAELAEWREVERLALVAFRTGLQTAAAGALSQTRIRTVFDLDELRERLAIWNADLDDGIVECVKLACLREQPALRTPRERIRFVDCTADVLRLKVIEPGADRARAELEVPRAVAERIAAEPAWREQFPALFSQGFISIDRYLR
jgi:hypothetical protein